MELDRGNKSYTVETLRELKKIYPEDELYFIIGSDMLSTFTQWYCWEEILELAFICAASREKGFEPDLTPYTDEQKKKFVLLDAEPFEVSSTQLRRIIAREADTDLLDEKVRQYIEDNDLYDDGLAEYRKILYPKLDEYRINHSECVSECAATLAETYGADVEKARLAGLLHDIMKNASAAEQLEVIEKSGESLTKLELMNTKIYKDIRNKANRIANCDAANIDKVVKAAMKQIEDIKLIDRAVGIDSLSEELREVAQLRLDNTDMSLQEIGENLSEPISRSGVNHRFQKLAKIADELRNGGGNK